MSKAQQATSGRAFRDDGFGPPISQAEREQVAALIDRALRAMRRGQTWIVVDCAEVLASAPLRSRFETALDVVLRGTITGLWQNGWQPADLHRIVARRLKPPHQQLIRAAIAAELSGYARSTVAARWWAQAEAAEITVWWPPEVTAIRACAGAQQGGPLRFVVTAIELLHLLAELPRLQVLDPLPGTAPTAATGPGREVDERILARVRALLAKAESTNYPAEAETFTAGAQALMARHSIDHALLAAAGRVPADQPVGRRIGVDNPYDAPKVSLLNAVADANRARGVWTREFGFVTVIGHPTDLDLIELLFTSLLVQGTSAMTRAGSRSNGYGGSRTRSFRQSFLMSYAQRVRERLKEATRDETAAAATESDRQHLLPVLSSRQEAVERATAELFPQVRTMSSRSALDAEGWASGRAAADLATFSASAPLGRERGAG